MMWIYIYICLEVLSGFSVGGSVCEVVGDL